jgi:hypothetical protein
MNTGFLPFSVQPASLLVVKELGAYTLANDEEVVWVEPALKRQQTRVVSPPVSGLPVRDEDIGLNAMRQ